MPVGAPAQLSESEQETLHATCRLLAERPTEAAGAISRLREEVSGRAVWARKVEEFEGYVRSLRGTDFAVRQQARLARDHRPRWKEFSPLRDTDAGPYCYLDAHAIRLLFDEPVAAASMSLEDAWDLALLARVLFDPSFDLRALGLQAIAEWRLPSGWGRGSAGRHDGLEYSNTRLAAFERIRVAVRELVQLYSLGSSAAMHPRDEGARRERLSPLSEQVWRYLEGRVGTSPELAAPSVMNSSAPAVRACIAQILRVKGPDAIVNKPGFGYWRPDAPPSWESLRPKRKPRVRPA